MKQSNEMRVLREFVEEFSPLHDMVTTEDYTYEDLTEIVIDVADEFKR